MKAIPVSHIVHGRWFDLFLEDPFKALFLLIAISLSIKIILIYLASSDAINTDGVIYIEGARALALGQFHSALETYPMPLLPAFIALFHGLVKDWCLAARMVSLTFSTLTLIPLYLITKDLFEKRSAFWACLAFALHPFGNHMAYLVYRGPLYLFFLACTIWSIVQYLKEPSGRHLLTSFIFGLLAASVRIEGLLILFIIPIIITILSFFDKKFRNYSLLLAMALSTLSIGGIVLLSQLNMQDLLTINRLGDAFEFFKRVISLKVFDQYMKIYHALEGMESLSILPTENQNFGEIARHYLWLVYLIGLLETISQALFPIYLIPAIISFSKKSFDLPKKILLVFFFSFLAIDYMHLISHDYTNRRFVWACSFILFPWVGHGMEIVWHKADKSSMPRLSKGAIMFLFFLLPILTTINHFEKVDSVVVQAGKWLKNSQCKDLSLLVNDRRIPFYASIDTSEGKRSFKPYFFVNTKLEGFSEIKRLAREKRPEIIILKLSQKHPLNTEELEGYHPIKTFIGKKRVVFILARKEVSRICDAE